MTQTFESSMKKAMRKSMPQPSKVLLFEVYMAVALTDMLENTHSSTVCTFKEIRKDIVYHNKFAAYKHRGVYF